MNFTKVTGYATPLPTTLVLSPTSVKTPEKGQNAAYPFFQVKGIRKTTQPREKVTLPTSPKRLRLAKLSAMKKALHTKKSTQPRI